MLDSEIEFRECLNLLTEGYAEMVEMDKDQKQDSYGWEHTDPVPIMCRIEAYLRRKGRCEPIWRCWVCGQKHSKYCYCPPRGKEV